MTFKHTKPFNRLNGSLPKIGIRPVIDGRRNGVRESLEEPIMTMAHSVAELISTEIKHSCGLPVECVVPDYCIGGVAETARCADLFRRENVGAVISVTRCWCYAAETIDMDPFIPKAIWGFNGTKKPGAVYLAGACAASDQMGLPTFKIYGRDVHDETDFSIPEDVRKEILLFARAGLAAATMRGTSYLSMGGVSMGIGGSIVDDHFFRAYLGMRNEYVDMSEFTRRIEREIYDPKEFKKAMEWVSQWCVETEDPNPPDIQKTRKEKDKDWETVVKMTLIARDLMVGNPRLSDIGYVEESEGHQAIAAGFQGQRHWTDHSPNGDFMEAILNSSFDWNGIREPFIVATENDSLNAVCMMFGHLLTGTAQIFADVRTYWSPKAIHRTCGKALDGIGSGGFLYLTNSGAAALDGTGLAKLDGQPAMKRYLDITPEEAEACVKATTWGPGKLVSFRGGGYSSAYQSLGGMPMTMTRLNIIKGLGPVLQVAEGESIDLPEDIYDEIVGRTDPTWPRTFFVPRITGEGAFRDVYTVMKRWGANHCVLTYGHAGADFLTLASILRIPVAMHNLSPEEIFRPSTWDSFGTADNEGADFRACRALGPLYGLY